MDYAIFNDLSRKMGHRLLRHYAIAVTEQVLPITKTHTAKEAIRLGKLLACGKLNWYASLECKKIQEQLTNLANNDNFKRRITRECALLCVSPIISMDLFLSVVNSVRNFTGAGFDNEIMKCIKPEHTRKSAGTRNHDAVGLTRQIFYEEDWDACGVLADCLEENNILDQAAWTHLRGDCHWQGCWVLDDLLGNWSS